MTISMALEQVSLAQRNNAVAQHRPAEAVHQAYRQAAVGVLLRNDLVDTILGEKFRPLFKAVCIDDAEIKLLEPLQLVPKDYFFHRRFHETLHIGGEEQLTGPSAPDTRAKNS